MDGVNCKTSNATDSMLTENDVVEAVAQFLTIKGFRITQKLSTIQTGDDLVAERNGANLFRLSVEAKGATSARTSSKRYGKAFDSAQVSVHVAEAHLKLSLF